VLFSRFNRKMDLNEILRNIPYLQCMLYFLYGVAGIQILYYLFFFLRLATYKGKAQAPVKEEPVSIIICARNEIANLKKNLPLILEQEYPDYEVIVASDNSWDGTSDFISEMMLKYPHLREVKYVENERYPKGKKFVLTLAIKASKHELLLLTDADCSPAGNQWLRRMQQHYGPGTNLVLGYSPYTGGGGFLNAFIRFETFYTAMQYLSYALAKLPYMGVGRNLSYRKSLFFAFKGFASHNHLFSGDDDLFVNETANATNTAIEIHPDSFTYTTPKKTWGEFWQQKSRHLSTGKEYKRKFKYLLGIFSLTHILTYALTITLLCFESTRWMALIAFAVRFVFQASIMGPVMKKLKCFNLWWGLLFFDLVYAIYYVLIGVKTIFVKNKKW
jgi:biofilm PGA synthesis N-glycosyltransferase PgaC